MPKTLTLSSLLTPDRIVLGLGAKEYRDAVLQLVDRLDAAGALEDRQTVDVLVDAELARGELPSLGTRALLAHYRTDAAKELGVAIGVSPQPFPFAPAKVPKAKFLVLLIGPGSAAKYYLKTLAALTRLLGHPQTAEALAGAASADEFLAIVADRDVTIQPELTVQDLMTREIQTVSPETLLSEALHLMARHARRGLPVVSDSGEVLGLIGEQELLQHFLPQVLGPAARQAEPPTIKDVEVRDVMQRSVMCLSEDELISDVLGAMLSEHVAQFPVVREGKLVGFLSRSDILNRLLKHYV